MPSFRDKQAAVRADRVAPKVCAHAQSLRRDGLGATQQTAAHQAPLSTGCSRQEHWSGLPCPPPGELPDTGIKLESPVSPALAGEFFTTVQLARSFLKVLESFPHYPHPFIFLVKCEE